MHTYLYTYTPACMDGSVYLVLQCSNSNRISGTGVEKKFMEFLEAVCIFAPIF